MLGPSQVTANFEDGTQTVLNAVSMELAMTEQCIDYISDAGMVTRPVVLGHTVTAAFDVVSFDIAKMPKDPTPEIKQKLDLIRVIRF